MSKPPKNQYSAVVHVEMLWHDECWANLKHFISDNKMTLCMICDDNFPEQDNIPQHAPSKLEDRVSLLATFPKTELGGHSHALFPSTNIKNADLIVKFNLKLIKSAIWRPINLYHFVPGHWIYNQKMLNMCDALGYKYFHVAVPPRPEMNFHNMIPLINGVDLPRAIHDYELYGWRDHLREGII